MIYGIDMGHTLRGVNGGAVGIRPESELTREVGFKVIEKLQKLGNEAINCACDEATSNSESLAYRVKIANDNKVDFFFSIHFNASNGEGQGVECYAMSSKGKEYAQKIVDEIASLGFKNRGVKDGSKLYVVKNTVAPAVLIECCFCDNTEDMGRYNAEDMATAIVKGITGEVVKEEPVIVELQPVVVQIEPVIEQIRPVVETPKVEVIQEARPVSDPKVLEIQKAMSKLKIANLVEDGIMGTNTRNAVKKFQEITQTETDGVVGQNTQFRINEILSKPLCSTTHKTNTFAVMYIQWRCGASVDGDFGKGTRQAVIKWQKSNGLGADGVVGNNTWSKFLG